MPGNASGQQRGESRVSRIERAIDIFKRQPEPPPKPNAPSADRQEWHESVEQKHVVPGPTVHDVGLSVFGETRSLHNRLGSNESIDTARQKIAHAIINGRELAHQTGKKPPSVHDPVEPSPESLRNSNDRAAYESSLRAAREAYLSGHDPTNGATHLNSRSTPDRSNWNGQHPISTHSGPYDNSFRKGDQKSRTVWLNTYLPDVQEKRVKASRR